MLTRIPVAALLLLAVSPLCAQNGWFQPSVLGIPEVHKALNSVDDRAAGIVEEWIRLVERPAPSGKEQARAKYIQAEMEKLGLSEIRTDDRVRAHARRPCHRSAPEIPRTRPLSGARTHPESHSSTSDQRYLIAPLIL
jgi:hypothetical protein